MRFEYWKSNKQWFWHLKAANGKIIAQGESYRRKVDCLSTIDAIRGGSDTPVVRIDVKK